MRTHSQSRELRVRQRGWGRVVATRTENRGSEGEVCLGSVRASLVPIITFILLPAGSTFPCCRGSPRRADVLCPAPLKEGGLWAG